MANGKITFQKVNDTVSWGLACGCMRPLGVGDIPFDRHEWQCKHNHGCYGEEGDDKGDTEVTENLGDFQEEVTAFDVLLCHAPFCQKSWSYRGPGGDERDVQML